LQNLSTHVDPWQFISQLLFLACQHHPIRPLIQTPNILFTITLPVAFLRMNPSRSHAKDFCGFSVLPFKRFPATPQHVAHGPVVDPDGSYFCFIAFRFFFLFSAQNSKNKGTAKHHSIQPFDAFHPSSSSNVEPVVSQRSSLKPQEKPNPPPTSKFAALRSYHMRQQGPGKF
jgi:hypothetical protein